MKTKIIKVDQRNLLIVPQEIMQELKMKLLDDIQVKVVNQCINIRKLNYDEREQNRIKLIKSSLYNLKHFYMHRSNLLAQTGFDSSFQIQYYLRKPVIVIQEEQLSVLNLTNVDNLDLEYSVEVKIDGKQMIVYKEE